MCETKLQQFPHCVCCAVLLSHFFARESVQIWNPSDSSIDVMEIVPLSMILEDVDFVEYLRKSNDVLGERQIVSLVKIRAFYQDANLFLPRQKEIRDQCLDLWKVPNKVRRAPAMEDPATSIANLLGASGPSFLNLSSTYLQSTNISDCIKSIYNWKWYLQNPKCPRFAFML